MWGNLVVDGNASGLGLRAAFGVFWCGLMLLGGPAAPAGAAGWVVNSSNDAYDGQCDSAHCSLREAIHAANASPGYDTITFSPGLGPIAPGSALPSLGDDGTTIQGGGNVTLKGRLRITSSYNKIQGLIITGSADHPGILIDGELPSDWPTPSENVIGTDGDGVDDSAESNIIINNDAGIQIYRGGHNTIAGNFIGLNAAGMAAPNNVGIHIVQSSATRIGTNWDNQSDGLERNVISGNRIHGVILVGSWYTWISGNYIGTDPSGASALGNGSVGISLQISDHNIIGPGNVISGNAADGIWFHGEKDTDVIGNFIGTNASGDQPMGNGGNGIYIEGYPYAGIPRTARGNQIGFQGNASKRSPDGNIIAYNGANGILITAETEKYMAVENPILYNSIFSNGLLGIDLTEGGKGCMDGPTANDVGDSDGGGNNTLNFSTVLAATSDSANTYVSAQIAAGLPSTQFVIQFFSSPACDPTGFGEGQTYLGEKSLSTDAAGNGGTGPVTFNMAVPVGHVITATATSHNGVVFLDTSEFSPCQPVTAASTFTLASHILQALVHLLDNLVEGRELSQEERADGLHRLLEVAMMEMERENADGVIARLEDFLVEVEVLVTDGGLAEEAGRYLDGQAREVIRLLKEGRLVS